MDNIIRFLNPKSIHPSWRPLLHKALNAMDKAYLSALWQDEAWLPGKGKLFNAFSLPLCSLKHILFGESPYPRKISANGYAFWDNAVDKLWSPTGLSREVNRATSLRNFIKMLLTAHNLSVTADKSSLVQTLPELFQHLLQQGFLLLNAVLVYRPAKANLRQDAQAWAPFMETLLAEIYHASPHTDLILLGKFAQKFADQPFKKFISEHPYNLSFIHNSAVLNYFKQFDLLRPV